MIMRQNVSNFKSNSTILKKVKTKLRPKPHSIAKDSLMLKNLIQKNLHKTTLWIKWFINSKNRNPIFWNKSKHNITN